MNIFKNRGKATKLIGNLDQTRKGQLLHLQLRVARIEFSVSFGLRDATAGDRSDSHAVPEEINDIASLSCVRNP